MHPTPFSTHSTRGTLLLFVMALGLFLPNSMAQGQSWDPDEILKAEGFQRPVETIAEAALAPRYLNVTLSRANADKSLFLHEIGDGPVQQDRFSLPYHELGGLFID